MNKRLSAIRAHWFGIDSSTSIAPNVLLMERDRVSQYQTALDQTTESFGGVFKGITGTIEGHDLTVIYSIGPAHVADCVEFLTQAFDVRRLFATGSIGGLTHEVGDIVNIDSCTTMDGYSLAHFGSTTRVEGNLGRVVDINPVGSTTSSQRMFTVPSVSWENNERLATLHELGYAGVDLETGPFLAACRRRNVPGSCVHWVTDTPLARSFYFDYENDPETAREHREQQHVRWLNLPKLILPHVLKSLRMT